MTLGYTVNDDGIWLECQDADCRIEPVNLGHSPTVGAVVEAFADHQRATTHTEQGVPA